ncbi:hypothetical protein FTO68_01935 [Methanocalculus taiwanensis]|uniref:Uncharacterized protein n=1 Tax=Methanocalculus taiwanensis TaxID=106207 RepID=A0ABD4TJ14_9EURY|nr:hypothetical protein [Methanocalculus taiwanensis]MCQ1537753.1 hypothetical protein [Methanocalculus taiwanensis]
MSYPYVHTILNDLEREGILKDRQIFAKNLVGGYLFPRSYELYIKDYEFEQWDNYLLESGYLGKGNVKIFCSDHHVFFEKQIVEGWPVVSAQQLIVDLIREGADCGINSDRRNGMCSHKCQLYWR